MKTAIFEAATGGLLSLLGVLIGSYISYKTIQKQERTRLLAEFYAEVFAAYAACVPDFNLNDLQRLVGALEKTKLLCSKESEEILIVLFHATTQKPVLSDLCKECIEKLQKSAKKDIRK